MCPKYQPCVLLASLTAEKRLILAEPVVEGERLEGAVFDETTSRDLARMARRSGIIACSELPSDSQAVSSAIRSIIAALCRPQ
jgi:hypothetical protein